MRDDPALGRVRKGLDRYVHQASQTAREIAEQVDTFAQRIEAIRALAQPEPEEEVARKELLFRRVHLQDQELTLALEELRAQNAALVEALDAVGRERARYLDLFDSASEAYVTTDRRGIVREANVAAATLLGLTKAAMPGKLLIAFVARRDTRAFRRILADLDGSATDTFDLHLRPRGGSPFPASLSLRRIRLEGRDAFDLRWIIRHEK